MSDIIVSKQDVDLVITESEESSVVVSPSIVSSVVISVPGPQGAMGPSGTSAPIIPMLITQQVIAENYTVTAGYNGLSVGDVNVAATYIVTVPSGANWVII
jgi:hypothetical protein